MGAVLSFFRPAAIAQGDWSQQEIAEFYRVEAALTQAGLRVTSDRGLSDEGDPWFVFCRFDGDVILHFARIDDLYVVASEAFERPLRGPDFRALLNSVAAEHPTLVPIPRKNTQGTSGNLVLHPAALLAAIVATVAFQLAGGDAMAGELASDGPATPMWQPGSEAHALGTAPGSHGPEPRTDAASDEPGRLTGEDEGRHARHALVLSAIALISANLPADQAVDSAGHILGEGPAGTARGHTVSVPVIEASQATVEGRRLPSRDEAALDARPTPVTGSSAPVQVGAAQAGTAGAPSLFAEIDLTRFNVLGLGAAGGQEIAVMRAAESAPPVTAILAARLAVHAVPIAIEKAASATGPTPAGGSAPSASGGTTSPTSSGSAAPSTAATPSAATVVGGANAAPTTAAPITASLTVAPAETGSGPAVIGSGASSAAAPSQGSAQSQAVTATATASAPEKVSVPGASAVAAPIVPANLAVRTALNSFIDQHTGITKTAAPGSDTAASTKLSDFSPSALAKLIGAGAASEFLSTFTTYDGSVTGSKLAITPASDLGVDPLKPGAAIGVASNPSTKISSEVIGATAVIGAVKDKEVPPTSDSSTKITDKVVEVTIKPGGVELTKTSLGDTAAGSSTKDAAPGTESAAKTGDKLIAPAATAPGAPEVSPSAPQATKVTDTHTDKVVEVTIKPGGAELTKTGLGDTAAGGSTKDAAPGTESAAVTGDKLNAPAATAPGALEVSPSAPQSTKVADTHTDKATEGAAKLAGVTTLDTSTLTHTSPLVAPQLLDEQGRQLIARFLETTTQVQTFVNERSFVIMDMDASHYGNPDFSVRTWSISHDVEISIIGITMDSHPAL